MKLNQVGAESPEHREVFVNILNLHIRERTTSDCTMKSTRRPDNAVSFGHTISFRDVLRCVAVAYRKGGKAVKKECATQPSDKAIPAL